MFMLTTINYPESPTPMVLNAISLDTHVGVKSSKGVKTPNGVECQGHGINPKLGN